MTLNHLDGLEEALGLVLPGPDERRHYALRLGVVCAWLVRGMRDVLLRYVGRRRGPHVVVRGRGGGGGGGCSAGDGLPQELEYRRAPFKEA